MKHGGLCTREVRGDEPADFIRSAFHTGGEAIPVVADDTSEAEIVALFKSAGSDLDLAIYNAGNNTPGRIIEMDTSYFEQSWRVVCFGGFCSVERLCVGCCRGNQARKNSAGSTMKAVRSAGISSS